MYDDPRATRSVSPRTSPSPAGWLAIIIWAGFTVLAFLFAIGSVTAFSRLTQGLPSVGDFDQIGFSEQSVIYDRTGKVELARFGGEKREVVAFSDIPPIVVDAQTAIEDKTFWENSGFDPSAIIAAGIDSLRGNSRGASTITQQLVRQRLLDPKLVQDPTRTFERKIKEIIQSIRLTQAFPGFEGKQQIIAAYLNQNYYGNQAYGVKAAAKVYFNKELKDLTPAEAAILAGLPKSPSNYDLVKNAQEACVGSTTEEDIDCPGATRLVVPPDSAIVQRRNQILELMASGRTPLSRDQYSPQQLRAAEADEVVVAPQLVPRWVAPHFVWAVQKELADKLCGEDVPTCDDLERGGLTITTTLDTKLQTIAEKWVKAAAIVPRSKDPAATAKSLGLTYAPWMRNLRGKDLNNGALVAIDYQTGELIAYVGSADYYATKSTPKFQAKFDVVGSGYRQPGSAFKPFNYLTGINDKRFTAATMFMDVATDFGGNYTPEDADPLERGPVRVRNALQFSLNIPSVKAAQVNEVGHLFARAGEYGMSFLGDGRNVGLSIALGVMEVKPVDLVTAYGTLANGGKKIGHTTILAIRDKGGADVVPPYQPPAGEQVATPQAAYIVTDILSGNTTPSINPFWGKFELTDRANKHRPATLKTGTNNDAKDLNAYGFIASPTAKGREGGEYALAVGVWNGNSDNTVVSTPAKPLFSIDVSTYVWQGFLQEATQRWAINDFAQPDGLVRAKIDPFTGTKPAQGVRGIDEWFIQGTEPQPQIPTGQCGEAVLQTVGFESKYPNWMTADRDWIARAERGPGTAGGVNRTRTAYFYNGAFHPYGNSWGALVAGQGCAGPSPITSCFPVPTPDASGVIPSFVPPSADPSASPPIILVPCPTPVPTASPSVTPSEQPSETPKHTPPPKDTPTPPPPPTPIPSASAQPAQPS